MSRNNSNVAQVIENATETTEQKAERQQRETAINRVAADKLTRLVTGSSAGMSYSMTLHKSLVKGIVSAFNDEQEVKAKDISADHQLSQVLAISREDFAKIVDEAFSTIIEPTQALYNAKNQSPVIGGMKPAALATACIGSMLPGTSANQATNFKNAVLSALEAAKKPAVVIGEH